MTTDLQHAITWLREQDQDGALELCLRAGVYYEQAQDLLAKTKTPALVAALLPVARLSLVQETALLRAVEATGWRPPVPETGPLLDLRVRWTATDFELKHHPDVLRRAMALELVETLLERDYLRMESYPSNSELGKFNIQLVFRPGLAPGGYQGPPHWPLRSTSQYRKEKGPNDAL